MNDHNPNSGAATALPKSIPSLSHIERDATFLHALLQGLEILITEAMPDPSPASNAMTALADAVVTKADRLAVDLCTFSDNRGKSQ